MFRRFHRVRNAGLPGRKPLCHCSRRGEPAVCYGLRESSLADASGFDDPLESPGSGELVQLLDELVEGCRSSLELSGVGNFRLIVQRKNCFGQGACHPGYYSVADSLDKSWRDGAVKGLYDANIFAGLYDVVAVKRRGAAAGILNSLGWLGGGFAPVLIAVAASRFGLSACISATAAIYLAIGLAMLSGARTTGVSTSSVH